MWPTGTAPTGSLHCNGANISMTTYEKLYDVIGNDYGMNTGTTFTADSATDVLSSTTHGLIDDDVIELTNSGGALPTGLTIDTKYFVITATTSTFQVSTTKGGSAVNFSTNGTGTNYWHNQMSVPDGRGEFIRGWANSQTTDPDRASRTDRGDGTTGDYVGTKQDHALDEHRHTTPTAAAAIGGLNSRMQGNLSGTLYTGFYGGNETRPRNLSLMFVIVY